MKTTGITLPILLAISCFATAADGPCLLFTADTEGRVGAGACCDGQSARGGLSQRCTLLATLRRSRSDLLLLDAGNALFGEDSMHSRGKVMAFAYAAMRYDAVNISYRDFRFGKETTLELLGDAGFAALSANLLDEATGKRLFKPHVVRSSGGVRVAIIGLTDLPPAAANLPHLKRQLAGIRVQAPEEALAQCLPQARAEADQLVLLYDTNVAGLRRMMEKHAGDFAAIFVAGLRPEILPATVTPPVLGAGDLGIDVTLVVLGKNIEATRLPVDGKAGDDELLRENLTSYMAAGVTPEVAPDVPPQSPQPRASATLTSLPTGKPAVLDLTAHNRAVELKLRQLSLLQKYGNVKPGNPDNRLLVVRTQWKNIIPLTLAEDRSLATTYTVPNLGDHLYLVINGHQLARIDGNAADAKGHLPVEPLEIEKIGDVVGGDAVFEVPADGVESLELRFYDFAHGSLKFPLLGSAVPPAPSAPVVAMQKNAILEAAIWNYHKQLSFHVNGQDLPKAPSGMTYVSFEMRARSLQVIEAASGMFDPHAAADAVTQVGTVCDWPDGKRYASLIVDGEFGYVPCFMTSAEPRFLPDVMTACVMVFLVPTTSNSLELRLDFPATDADNEAAAQPSPMVFKLEGTKQARKARKPIVSARDGAFRLAITNQSTPAVFAGRKPEPDMRLLVLDASVENTAKTGDWFQVREQLRVLTSEGDEIEMDESSTRDHPPTGDIVWVPGGERRSFAVVFRIPASERAARLRFTASASQNDLKLAPIAEPE